MSGIFDSNPARCGGVFLTWKDLSVSIPQGYGIRRFLLHNVTGYAEPGELVAVMGPSGSGKTTLLDALAGRLSSITNQSGEILVNGRRQLLTYGNSAYVPQDDSLIETLTVYETIVYSAQLQLPKTMPMVEKAARVGSVVEEMGLQDCVHTKIGGWSKNGLSGGEKRRVSIAIEILTRPRLLFLDEPTSGLDSAAAFLVMRKLKQLVTDGRTLIVTIHQPSSEVFMLFHSLCLLSSGKTIYFGEARKAQQFFTESGFPCSTFRNPSDHFLWVIKSELEEDIEMGDLIGNIEGREMGDLSQNVNPVHRTDSLVHAYSSSETALEVKAAIQNISSKKGDVLKGGSEARFCRQTFYLTRRSFVNMYRDVTYYWFRLFVYVALALCVGTVYFRVGLTHNSIQARAAMLMFVVAYMTFLGVVSFPSFLNDLKIFSRERLNGHYGVAAFVIANSLSSFPFLFLLSGIPGAIIYYLGELHSGIGRFGFFTFTLLSCLVAVEGLLMAVASIVPDFFTGIIAGTGILGIFLLNGGFLRLVNDLPRAVWRYPMSYISLHTYANRAFYNNDFTGLYFDNRQHGKPPVSGEKVLREVFQMETSYSKWWNVMILLGMAIFYRLLFFMCMKLREKLPSLTQKLKNGHLGPQIGVIAARGVLPHETP